MVVSKSIDVDVQGDRELRRRLGRLHGRQFLSTMNSAARASMKPVLTLAKELTPVRTGALRDSLGITRKTNARAGEINVLIQARRTFKRTTVDGATGFKSKEAFKGLQRSDKGNQSPVFYIKFIEFGRTDTGNKVRGAGPARMLRDALERGRSDTVRTLRTELWRRIHRLTTTAT